MKTIIASLCFAFLLVAFPSVAFAIDINTAKVCTVTCVTNPEDAQARPVISYEKALGETDELATRNAQKKCANVGAQAQDDKAYCQLALEYIVDHLK